MGFKSRAQKKGPRQYILIQKQISGVNNLAFCSPPYINPLISSTSNVNFLFNSPTLKQFFKLFFGMVENVVPN